MDWIAPDIDLSRVGVQTVYRGVTFRSRLEAKWAAFFDIVRWPWEYEPIDLSGYIPDFVVAHPRAPLLVEVKPDFELDKLDAHARKICLSGWRGDFMIVGPALSDVGGEVSIGRIAYFEDDCPKNEWCPIGSAIAHRCIRCGKFSAHHDSLSFRCVVCGGYDGNALIEPMAAEKVRAAWSAAGEVVRWKGRPT